MAQSEPKTALVLSGGGARGAYEAGVIRYLYEELGQEIGGPPRLDILSGTSAGALNAVVLAACLHNPRESSSRLSEVWSNLDLDALLDLRLRDLWDFLRTLMAGRRPLAGESAQRGGLFETGGLQRLIREMIDWDQIGRNLEQGHLEALTVSTTHVGSGRTVVFVDRHEDGLPPWSHDTSVSAVRTRIGPEHALASAAIPVVFPAVKVDGTFYCDGGLRQNTPLSPAVRLGADRILVISLKHRKPAAQALSREREEAFPSPIFLMGKALNALMLDHTDYDIDRMQRVNALLDAGTAAFGAHFLSAINSAAAGGGMPLRKIETLLLRPSRDIGVMAAQHVRKKKRTGKSLIWKALRRMAAAEARDEADLLSYVLLDGEFTSQLVQLGYEDAKSEGPRLGEFFSHGLLEKTA